MNEKELAKGYLSGEWSCIDNEAPNKISALARAVGVQDKALDKLAGKAADLEQARDELCAALADLKNDLFVTCPACGEEYHARQMSDAENRYVASLRAEVERFRRALGMNRPWPLLSVLEKLIEAGDILLRTMDYDGHGWEQIDHALASAREIRAALDRGEER
jgi:hypothetical protein